jgi:geranylgeranyl diphosphate synthase type II
MDFEKELSRILDQHLSKKDGDTPAHLASSIRYSVFTPGKRIRPRLLLSCAGMLGLEVPQALPAAAALELIHCFTLIHDDLPCMDNDDMRRGQPSNHKKFGEATALLAGDGLMALALDVFLDTPLSPGLVLGGLQKFIDAVGPRGVIGGQAAESVLLDHPSLENLRKVHAQKTGALFLAALLIPKEFVGISDASPQGKAIHQFGYQLGQAFQIADDLEDEVTAHPPQTSILAYLSAKEAIEMTSKNLTHTLEDLRLHWGQNSNGLVELGTEVLHKLKGAR